MLWCGWRRWRRKAPFWLGGKSHLCEHVCACHDDDDDNGDKSYLFAPLRQDRVMLRLTQQQRSLHLFQLGCNSFLLTYSLTSRKVHWGEAVHFLEFRTKISSANRILLILTPLSTFLVTRDKIRQLSQSNPKHQLLGQMNNEQWRRLFFASSVITISAKTSENENLNKCIFSW